ncbi:hypothetical protein U1Q18_007712 [Sarracenia purpurea var. burkii]
MDGIDSGIKGDFRSNYIFGKGREPDLVWIEDNFGNGIHELGMDLVSKDNGPSFKMSLGQPNEKLRLGGPRDFNPIPISHCTDSAELNPTHSLNQNLRRNESSLEIRAHRWKRRAREKNGPPSVVSTQGDGKKRKSEGKEEGEDEGKQERAANSKKFRVVEAMSGTHQTFEVAEIDSQSRRAP